MIYLAKFLDFGDKNRITAIYVYPDGVSYRPEYYLMLAEETYNLLTSSLLTKKVFVTKSVVQPIQIADLTFEDLDMLREAKDLAHNRCHMFLSSTHSQLSNAYYWEWLMAWSELFNVGFVITDSNREAKYLEVVNTGNADLIGKLERYLKSIERMEFLTYAYKSSIDFMDRVNESTDPEQIYNMTNDFLTRVAAGQ